MNLNSRVAILDQENKDKDMELDEINRQIQEAQSKLATISKKEIKK